MNKQVSNGNYLPLMEIFYSIQGEGDKAGEAAVFIRLSGCDICCHWCDVKESWNNSDAQLISVEEIIKKVEEFQSDVVVVTGGEPLNYNLDYLCGELKKRNKYLCLETSGSSDYSGEWDWICLSPKQKCPPIAEMYNKASELKVVICDNAGLEWAEKNALLVKSSCLLYLQPEWREQKKNTGIIIEYVKRNPKWKLSVQLHKFVGIP